MRRTVSRRGLLQCAGVTGVAGLAGCLGGIGGGGRGPIQLGILSAETGGLASVGVPLRDVSLLTEIQVNDADTAQTVETQVEDSQTDPQAAISAAGAIADAGYPMVMGPLTSEATIQVTEQVYRPREVVCCTPGSTAPAITTLNDNDYVYRTISSDAFQGRALAQVADQRLGASSVSILYVNDAYGQALNRTFSESFEERGGTIQTSASIAKEQNSYASKLATAMEGDPDALFVVAFPGSANQLLRDFYDNYGKDTPIIGPDSLRDPELPDQVGQSMTNVIGVSSIAAGPGNEAVAQLYRDEYEKDTPPFFSYAYDAAAVLVLANAAAGENEGPSVRDEMLSIANPGGTEVTPGNFAQGVSMAAQGEEIQYKGASSDVDFDENGDMKAVNYAVYRYTEADEIENVDTINYTAD